MTHPRGIHHLAISTCDIKKQIEFFSEVLGFELVALFWMHGVPGAWHGFLRLNDRSYLALVHHPANAAIESKIGITHAGNGASPCAGGTMQHLAFDVEDEAQLLALRDRVRGCGIHAFGPIDHGFCKSIYFAGPEDLTLEVSTSHAAIDGDSWIDPEVVELAGISPDELARYRHPVERKGSTSPVPQPPLDSPGPRLTYPAKVYARMVAMSDDYLLRTVSETTPPVARHSRS
ncbi:MAG TPA: glyoxalase [Deltaproteobacteria bacterium]|jgi:catechol 2,3-dioxygenase-like lactoylglutathione lyase family enzyme|nr:glyoxalase [Deltaproteobacteria bacterium]